MQKQVVGSILVSLFVSLAPLAAASIDTQLAFVSENGLLPKDMDAWAVSTYDVPLSALSSARGLGEFLWDATGSVCQVLAWNATRLLLETEPSMRFRVWCAVFNVPSYHATQPVRVGKESQLPARTSSVFLPFAASVTCGFSTWCRTASPSQNCTDVSPCARTAGCACADLELVQTPADMACVDARGADRDGWPPGWSDVQFAGTSVASDLGEDIQLSVDVSTVRVLGPLTFRVGATADEVGRRVVAEYMLADGGGASPGPPGLGWVPLQIDIKTSAGVATNATVTVSAARLVGLFSGAYSASPGTGNTRPLVPNDHEISAVIDGRLVTAGGASAVFVSGGGTAVATLPSAAAFCSSNFVSCGGGGPTRCNVSQALAEGACSCAGWPARTDEGRRACNSCRQQPPEVADKLEAPVPAPSSGVCVECIAALGCRTNSTVGCSAVSGCVCNGTAGWMGDKCDKCADGWQSTPRGCVACVNEAVCTRRGMAFVCNGPDTNATCVLGAAQTLCGGPRGRFDLPSGSCVCNAPFGGASCELCVGCGVGGECAIPDPASPVPGDACTCTDPNHVRAWWRSGDPAAPCDSCPRGTMRTDDGGCVDTEVLCPGENFDRDTSEMDGTCVQHQLDHTAPIERNSASPSLSPFPSPSPSPSMSQSPSSSAFLDPSSAGQAFGKSGAFILCGSSGAPVFTCGASGMLDEIHGMCVPCPLGPCDPCTQRCTSFGCVTSRPSSAPSVTMSELPSPSPSTVGAGPNPHCDGHLILVEGEKRCVCQRGTINRGHGVCVLDNFVVDAAASFVAADGPAKALLALMPDKSAIRTPPVVATGVAWTILTGFVLCVIFAVIVVESARRCRHKL